MKARKRQIAFYKGWGRMAVKRGRAVSRMKRVVNGRHLETYGNMMVSLASYTYENILN